MHTVTAVKRRVCAEVHVLRRRREDEVVAVLPAQLSLRGTHLPLQIPAAVVTYQGVEELQDVVPRPARGGSAVTCRAREGLASRTGDSACR